MPDRGHGTAPEGGRLFLRETRSPGVTVFGSCRPASWRRPRMATVITAADASLHQPTSDDPTWAETNFFGFYVPELALNCGVYTLFRANLGVGLSTICMNSK